MGFMGVTHEVDGMNHASSGVATRVATPDDAWDEGMNTWPIPSSYSSSYWGWANGATGQHDPASDSPYEI